MTFDIDQLNKTFSHKLEADKKYAPEWMVDWAYQSVRKRRNKKYANELPQDFYSIEGLNDLVKWYNWFLPVYPDYFPAALTSPLIQQAKERDKAIFKALGLEYDFENYYDNRIGINNAHDYLYPQFYPVPDRQKINTVLDFGAGSGRQSNLWHNDGHATFIGMDATPKAYPLQHVYYTTMLHQFKPGAVLNDYVFGPFDGFKNDGGLYHIPTWRFDLIPDQSVDLVICIQVLHELSGKLAKYAIDQFQRVLKPGGVIYIRDTPWWTNLDSVDLDNYIVKSGFALEFKPYIKLNKEMIGLPRIYRKRDAETELLLKNDNHTSYLKRLFITLDAQTKGKLSGMMGKGK